MKINVNNPSFILFLDNITNAILSNVSVDSYFNLPQEKKMGVLYVAYKLMKKSISLSTKLTDNEMKAFVIVLLKKNEEIENYEFAAVLRDISNNFDAVNEFTKPAKRTIRTTKTDKSING